MYNRFEEGREDFNAGVRPGSPSTSVTVMREVADDIGISFDSLQTIFTDVLGMKREAAAKIVQKIAKFLAKISSHEHRLGDVDDVQRRSRFAQKDHN